MNGSTTAAFDRDKMARDYAQRHLRSDPGTRFVYHLRTGSPEREIRLVEVNDQIVERIAPLEPLDFGVDVGNPNGHTLNVVDVTPAQWERITRGELALPAGWVLDDAAVKILRRAGRR